MAQTCYATVVTPDRTLSFTLSCTNDAWNVLKDSINTLNLYEVAKGLVILKAYGAYTAGGGIFRIRNTVTGVVKAMWLGTMPKGLGVGFDAVEKFEPPVLVEVNDVIECFCTVAGT